jgi:hypothetical protein
VTVPVGSTYHFEIAVFPEDPASPPVTYAVLVTGGGGGGGAGGGAGSTVTLVEPPSGDSGGGHSVRCAAEGRLPQGRDLGRDPRRLLWRCGALGHRGTRCSLHRGRAVHGDGLDQRAGPAVCDDAAVGAADGRRRPPAHGGGRPAHERPDQDCLWARVPLRCRVPPGVRVERAVQRRRHLRRVPARATPACSPSAPTARLPRPRMGTQ